MPKHYYEFKDPTSSKFWEIDTSGSTVTVRFGKIGTDGQTTVKKFGTPAEAKSHAEKITAEKQRKGYRPASAGGSPKGAAPDTAAAGKGGAKAAAKPAAKSSAKPLRIRCFVTINLVSENPAEQCESFGPDASEPFPNGPMVDLFLDGDDAIVGVRGEDGEIALGAEAASEHCAALFKGELAPLAPRGKLHSALGSSAVIEGMKFNWDGDAQDLPEDDRDAFLEACERKGAIVIWKQIRVVDWKPKDAADLESLLDQGDHDSYEDFVAVV